MYTDHDDDEIQEMDPERDLLEALAEAGEAEAIAQATPPTTVPTVIRVLG